MKPWPTIRLGEVLKHFTEYIEAPEPREYRKLSVKLYGKGVVVDTPTDGAMLKMKRYQLAKAGQVILSEIWGKKGAIGFVPPAGEGALCTSHFFLFDVREDRLDPRWLRRIFDANHLQEQLDAEAKGTTGYAAVGFRLTELNLNDLRKVPVPVPTHAEQRRIVAELDALQAEVDALKRLQAETAAELDALLPAILDKAFKGEL